MFLYDKILISRKIFDKENIYRRIAPINIRLNKHPMKAEEREKNAVSVLFSGQVSFFRKKGVR